MSAALGDLTLLSDALAAAAGAEEKRAAVKSKPKGLGVGGVAARQKIMCTPYASHTKFPNRSGWHPPDS